MDPKKAYALRTVEERGVRLVRLWFTDLLGRPKSVAISPAEIETAFEEGMTVDGSAIDGFDGNHGRELILRPDASTFALLPWADPSEPSGRMFCDVVDQSGANFVGDARGILSRVVGEAQEMGYTFFTAPEVEFFYFNSVDDPTPTDRAGYFDLTTQDISTPLRKRTLHMLESMGIPVEYSFHEDSPGQHEIDLRHDNAVAMADNIMTLRLVVKKIAADNGCYATFMPTPLEGVQGSGMHTHLSLFQGDTNAFHDPGDENGLSKEAKAFMAGLLFHAREITAITNQLVNSYKRLTQGAKAPVFAAWSPTDLSALVRVPTTKQNKQASTRLEYRAPDAACNPYLVFSLLLAAGLKGIREGYVLPKPTSGDLTQLRPADAAKLGLATLPRSLGEALFELERSELVRETLGDHALEWILRKKDQEWSEYTSHVTRWELDRYLPNW